MKRILLACLIATTFSFIGCKPKDSSQNAEPNENTTPAESKADVNTPDVSSDDIGDEYPRLIWKSTHVSSGSNATGTMAATNFDVVEDRMSQLDWSNEASDLPSMIVELDSNNSLTIEMVASEEATERPIVATWKRAGETKGSTTAIQTKTSKPLKDVDQALTLLRAHFAGEDLEPLAEWVTP
ncbi:MAG: hypothetical protein AAFN77_11910 [Planctomycetota bacterium]